MLLLLLLHLAGDDDQTIPADGGDRVFGGAAMTRRKRLLYFSTRGFENHITFELLYATLRNTDQRIAPHSSAQVTCAPVSVYGSGRTDPHKTETHR